MMNSMASVVLKFSPPAWGWSCGCIHGLPLVGVLPTRVGMVLSTVY